MAVFVRNLPRWERLLRLALALAVVVLAWTLLDAPLYRWLGLGTGLGLALTSLFGFCPACAMFGRRL